MSWHTLLSLNQAESSPPTLDLPLHYNYSGPHPHMTSVCHLILGSRRTPCDSSLAGRSPYIVARRGWAAATVLLGLLRKTAGLEKDSNSVQVLFAAGAAPRTPGKRIRRSPARPATVSAITPAFVRVFRSVLIANYEPRTREVESLRRSFRVISSDRSHHPSSRRGF